jgi:leucyl/phenylalanyl-tRNA--protein transferase
MGQTLFQLHDDDLTFPALKYALTEPNGLLALGGDLSPQRLISAYSKGIFPWFSDNDPLMWWSPDPRAVIKLDELRINRTLRKQLNKSPYQVTLNQDFSQVISYCADAPFRDEDTWIVSDMQSAYIKLHQLGFAHSIEVWQQDENSPSEDKRLGGGLYGVAINGFFSGESMFYTKSNASKFALVALAKLLSETGVDFIDCQLLNPFLVDMGAIEISRDEFIKHQQSAITISIHKDFWQTRTLFIT